MRDNDDIDTDDTPDGPLSVSELMAHTTAIHRNERELLAGRGLVHWDGKARAFYLYDGADPKGYEITAEGLKKHSELVDWIYHLREKKWFTQQHLSDFLDLVQQKLGDPRNWGIKEE